MSASVDVRSFEEKWRRRWEESKAFESNPEPGRPKFFITVAYPYPNSPQHIGHARTYTLTDAHARFLRMRGFNVLLPMAFHYTGTPVLSMSKRLAANDRELVEEFTKTYNVPVEKLEEFKEPLNIAKYFHEEIKAGMKEMGYSFDWRREFTTIDPQYSRFIEWQFKKLFQRGYIKRGSHPVGWCPNDGNPVGQHDTKGDVEPEIEEFVLIKFRFDDGYFFPTATLRAETVFGVTNAWINPEEEYARTGNA
ncbi:MAG: class I tRNA ligase family protein [Thermoproteota archaeon]